MHYRISDLNQDEKPREKLQQKGVQSLSDIELLALVIRSGGKNQSVIELARLLLSEYKNFKGLLEADINKLAQIKYINKAKACGLVAALEIGRRLNQSNDNTMPKIIKPNDVAELVRPDILGRQKEMLYLLSLNSRNRLLAKDLVSVGTIDESMLSPREIFKQALYRNACSIILVHNHPSNEATPSDDDIKITKKVEELSHLMGIPLLDHIILTDHNFISLKSLANKGGDKSAKNKNE